MARIPYPDSTKLPPEVNELLQQAHLKVFSTWAHSVSTIGLIVNLGAAQFAKLELPRAIREMVTLLGASTDLAEYEWVQHVALSKDAGVSDEQRPERPTVGRISRARRLLLDAGPHRHGISG